MQLCQGRYNFSCFSVCVLMHIPEMEYHERKALYAQIKLMKAEKYNIEYCLFKCDLMHRQLRYSKAYMGDGGIH